MRRLLFFIMFGIQIISSVDASWKRMGQIGRAKRRLDLAERGMIEVQQGRGNFDEVLLQIGLGTTELLIEFGVEKALELHASRTARLKKARDAANSMKRAARTPTQASTRWKSLRKASIIKTPKMSNNPVKVGKFARMRQAAASQLKKTIKFPTRGQAVGAARMGAVGIGLGVAISSLGFDSSTMTFDPKFRMRPGDMVELALTLAVPYYAILKGAFDTALMVLKYGENIYNKCKEGGLETSCMMSMNPMFSVFGGLLPEPNDEQYQMALDSVPIIGALGFKAKHILLASRILMVLSGGLFGILYGFVAEAVLAVLIDRLDIGGFKQLQKDRADQRSHQKALQADYAKHGLAHWTHLYGPSLEHMTPPTTTAEDLAHTLDKRNHDFASTTKFSSTVSNIDKGYAIHPDAVREGPYMYGTDSKHPVTAVLRRKNVCNGTSETYAPVKANINDVSSIYWTTVTRKLTYSLVGTQEAERALIHSHCDSNITDTDCIQNQYIPTDEWSKYYPELSLYTKTFKKFEWDSDFTNSIDTLSSPEECPTGSHAILRHVRVTEHLYEFEAECACDAGSDLKDTICVFGRLYKGGQCVENHYYSALGFMKTQRKIYSVADTRGTVHKYVNSSALLKYSGLAKVDLSTGKATSLTDGPYKQFTYSLDNLRDARMIKIENIPGRSDMDMSSCRRYENGQGVGQYGTDCVTSDDWTRRSPKNHHHLNVLVGGQYKAYMAPPKEWSPLRLKPFEQQQAKCEAAKCLNWKVDPNSCGEKSVGAAYAACLGQKPQGGDSIFDGLSVGEAVDNVDVTAGPTGPCDTNRRKGKDRLYFCRAKYKTDIEKANARDCTNEDTMPTEFKYEDYTSNLIRQFFGCDRATAGTARDEDLGRCWYCINTQGADNAKRQHRCPVFNPYDCHTVAGDKVWTEYSKGKLTRIEYPWDDRVDEVDCPSIGEGSRCYQFGVGKHTDRMFQPSEIMLPMFDQATLTNGEEPALGTMVRLDSTVSRPLYYGVSTFAGKITDPTRDDIRNILTIPTDRYLHQRTSTNDNTQLVISADVRVMAKENLPFANMNNKIVSLDNRPIPTNIEARIYAYVEEKINACTALQRNVNENCPRGFTKVDVDDVQICTPCSVGETVLDDPITCNRVYQRGNMEETFDSLETYMNPTYELKFFWDGTRTLMIHDGLVYARDKNVLDTFKPLSTPVKDLTSICTGSTVHFAVDTQLDGSVDYGAYCGDHKIRLLIDDEVSNEIMLPNDVEWQSCSPYPVQPIEAGETFESRANLICVTASNNIELYSVTSNGVVLNHAAYGDTNTLKDVAVVRGRSSNLILGHLNGGFHLLKIHTDKISALELPFDQVGNYDVGETDRVFVHGDFVDIEGGIERPWNGNTLTRNKIGVYNFLGGEFQYGHLVGGGTGKLWYDIGFMYRQPINSMFSTKTPFEKQQYLMEFDNGCFKNQAYEPGFAFECTGLTGPDEFYDEENIYFSKPEPKNIDADTQAKLTRRAIRYKSPIDTPLGQMMYESTPWWWDMRTTPVNRTFDVRNDGANYERWPSFCLRDESKTHQCKGDDFGYRKKLTRVDQFAYDKYFHEVGNPINGFAEGNTWSGDERLERDSSGIRNWEPNERVKYLDDFYATRKGFDFLTGDEIDLDSREDIFKIMRFGNITINGVVYPNKRQRSLPFTPRRELTDGEKSIYEKRHSVAPEPAIGMPIHFRGEFHRTADVGDTCDELDDGNKKHMPIFSLRECQSYAASINKSVKIVTTKGNYGCVYDKVSQEVVWLFSFSGTMSKNSIPWLARLNPVRICHRVQFKNQTVTENCPKDQVATDTFHLIASALGIDTNEEVCSLTCPKDYTWVGENSENGPSMGSGCYKKRNARLTYNGFNGLVPHSRKECEAECLYDPLCQGYVSTASYNPTDPSSDYSGADIRFTLQRKEIMEDELSLYMSNKEPSALNEQPDDMYFRGSCTLLKFSGGHEATFEYTSINDPHTLTTIRFNMEDMGDYSPIRYSGELNPVRSTFASPRGGRENCALGCLSCSNPVTCDTYHVGWNTRQDASGAFIRPTDTVVTLGQNTRCLRYPPHNHKLSYRDGFMQCDRWHHNHAVDKTTREIRITNDWDTSSSRYLPNPCHMSPCPSGFTCHNVFGDNRGYENFASYVTCKGNKIADFLPSCTSPYQTHASGTINHLEGSNISMTNYVSSDKSGLFCDNENCIYGCHVGLSTFGTLSVTGPMSYIDYVFPSTKKLFDFNDLRRKGARAAGTTCIGCQPGSYRSSDKTCERCTIGRFSFDGSVCRDCPLGYTSPNGAGRCRACTDTDMECTPQDMQVSNQVLNKYGTAPRSVRHMTPTKTIDKKWVYTTAYTHVKDIQNPGLNNAAVYENLNVYRVKGPETLDDCWRKTKDTNFPHILMHGYCEPTLDTERDAFKPVLDPCTDATEIRNMSMYLTDPDDILVDVCINACESEETCTAVYMEGTKCMSTSAPCEGAIQPEAYRGNVYNWIKQEGTDTRSRSISTCSDSCFTSDTCKRWVLKEADTPGSESQVGRDFECWHSENDNAPGAPIRVKGQTLTLKNWVSIFGDVKGGHKNHHNPYFPVYSKVVQTYTNDLGVAADIIDRVGCVRACKEHVWCTRYNSDGAYCTLYPHHGTNDYVLGLEMSSQTSEDVFVPPNNVKCYRRALSPMFEGTVSLWQNNRGDLSISEMYHVWTANTYNYLAHLLVRESFITHVSQFNHLYLTNLTPGDELEAIDIFLMTKEELETKLEQLDSIERPPGFTYDAAANALHRWSKIAIYRPGPVSNEIRKYCDGTTCDTNTYPNGFKSWYDATYKKWRTVDETCKYPTCFRGRNDMYMRAWEKISDNGRGGKMWDVSGFDVPHADYSISLPFTKWNHGAWTDDNAVRACYALAKSAVDRDWRPRGDTSYDGFMPIHGTCYLTYGDCENQDIKFAHIETGEDYVEDDETIDLHCDDCTLERCMQQCVITPDRIVVKNNNEPNLPSPGTAVHLVDNPTDEETYLDLHATALVNISWQGEIMRVNASNLMYAKSCTRVALIENECRQTETGVHVEKYFQRLAMPPSNAITTTFTTMEACKQHAKNNGKSKFVVMLNTCYATDEYHRYAISSTVGDDFIAGDDDTSYKRALRACSAQTDCVAIAKSINVALTDGNCNTDARLSEEQCLRRFPVTLDECSQDASQVINERGDHCDSEATYYGRWEPRYGFIASDGGQSDGPFSIADITENTMVHAKQWISDDVFVELFPITTGTITHKKGCKMSDYQMGQARSRFVINATGDHIKTANPNDCPEFQNRGIMMPPKDNAGDWSVNWADVSETECEALAQKHSLTFEVTTLSTAILNPMTCKTTSNTYTPMFINTTIQTFNYAPILPSAEGGCAPAAGGLPIVINTTADRCYCNTTQHANDCRCQADSTAKNNAGSDYDGFCVVITNDAEEMGASAEMGLNSTCVDAAIPVYKAFHEVLNPTLKHLRLHNQKLDNQEISNNCSGTKYYSLGDYLKQTYIDQSQPLPDGYSLTSNSSDGYPYQCGQVFAVYTGGDQCSNGCHEQDSMCDGSSGGDALPPPPPPGDGGGGPPPGDGGGGPPPGDGGGGPTFCMITRVSSGTGENAKEQYSWFGMSEACTDTSPNAFCDCFSGDFPTCAEEKIPSTVQPAPTACTSKACAPGTPFRWGTKDLAADSNTASPTDHDCKTFREFAPHLPGYDTLFKVPPDTVTLATGVEKCFFDVHNDKLVWSKSGFGEQCTFEMKKAKNIPDLNATYDYQCKQMESIEEQEYLKDASVTVDAVIIDIHHTETTDTANTHRFYFGHNPRHWYTARRIYGRGSMAYYTRIIDNYMTPGKMRILSAKDIMNTLKLKHDRAKSTCERFCRSLNYHENSLYPTLAAPPTYVNAYSNNWNQWAIKNNNFAQWAGKNGRYMLPLAQHKANIEAGATYTDTQTSSLTENWMNEIITDNDGRNHYKWTMHPVNQMLGEKHLRTLYTRFGDDIANDDGSAYTTVDGVTSLDRTTLPGLVCAHTRVEADVEKYGFVSSNGYAWLPCVGSINLDNIEEESISITLDEKKEIGGETFKEYSIGSHAKVYEQTRFGSDTAMSGNFTVTGAEYDGASVSTTYGDSICLNVCNRISEGSSAYVKTSLSDIHDTDITLKQICDHANDVSLFSAVSVRFTSISTLGSSTPSFTSLTCNWRIRFPAVYQNPGVFDRNIPTLRVKSGNTRYVFIDNSDGLEYFNEKAYPDTIADDKIPPRLLNKKKIELDTNKFLFFSFVKKRDIMAYDTHYDQFDETYGGDVVTCSTAAQVGDCRTGYSCINNKCMQTISVSAKPTVVVNYTSTQRWGYTPVASYSYRDATTSGKTKCKVNTMYTPWNSALTASEISTRGLEARKLVYENDGESYEGSDSRLRDCAKYNNFGFNGTDCTKCPAGTFSHVGSAQCISCDYTRVRSINGETCTQCLEGQTPNADQSGCVPCPAGTYKDITMVSCHPCPVGNYSGVGAHQCKEYCTHGTVPEYGSACTVSSSARRRLEANVDDIAVEAGFECSGHVGCMNPDACNYNSSATCDSGLCTFKDAFKTCEGSCEHDENENNVCDELELENARCSDPNACNPIDMSNTTQFVNDTLCVYDNDIIDCNGVCKNGEHATGLCTEQFGCMDSSACNYNANALAHTANTATCTYPTDLRNGTLPADAPARVRDCSDTCFYDEDNDGLCDEEEGCRIASACNYNPNAVNDARNDATCIIPTDTVHMCVNGERECIEGPSELAGHADKCANEVACSTDATACNYDDRSGLTHVDDLCTYPSTGLTCEGECNSESSIKGICDTSPCTTVEDCYNAFKTCRDDGDCTDANAAILSCDAKNALHELLCCSDSTTCPAAMPTCGQDCSKPYGVTLVDTWEISINAYPGIPRDCVYTRSESGCGACPSTTNTIEYTVTTPAKNGGSCQVPDNVTIPCGCDDFFENCTAMHEWMLSSCQDKCSPMCDDVKEALREDECKAYMDTQPPCDPPTYTFGGNVTEIELCVGDFPIHIQWSGGEHNMLEAVSSDCSNSTLVNDDGPVAAFYQNVLREMTAAELGAEPGETRYFRCTRHCSSARLEVSCPSNDIPDNDPDFTGASLQSVY